MARRASPSQPGELAPADCVDASDTRPSGSAADAGFIDPVRCRPTHGADVRCGRRVAYPDTDAIRTASRGPPLQSRRAAPITRDRPADAVEDEPLELIRPAAAGRASEERDGRPCDLRTRQVTRHTGDREGARCRRGRYGRLRSGSRGRGCRLVSLATISWRGRWCGCAIVTVQLPRSCQPLETPPAALANMRIVLSPLNADVNAIARFSVNTEPLADAELLPRLIAHELPCRIEPLPNILEVHAVPASFISTPSSWRARGKPCMHLCRRRTTPIRIPGCWRPGCRST